MIDLRSLLQILSLTVTATLLLECQSATECNDAYQCSLNTISTNGTDIECNGYHSCTQAIEITAIGDAKIICSGSFSCYQAKLIQRTSAISGTIECVFLFIIKRHFMII